MAAIPTFVCQANQKWTSTGYKVLTGQKIVIMWISGEWTANPQWRSPSMVTGTGNPNFPNAKPGYALPGAPEGALVGRVTATGTPFLVGNRATVPSNLTGDLFLTINDDLDNRYGVGYSDNIGALKVMIFNENQPT